MKILHVVDSMEVGGAETLVSQMCQLQRAQGHEVAVYAVAALGALGERMRADGFHIRSNVGLHLTDSTINFYRLFRESRPEVVHIHNPTPTIYASLAARLAGTLSIISTRHSLVAPPHDRVAEAKYSIAARFCDWIVGICDATAENLKSLRTIPPEKIVRIYNGATPLVTSNIEKQPSKSGFTLLFVGRLQPVKNLPLLLNAFRIALDSAPGLKMWMVGDGTERTALEKLAADLQLSGSVTFWGQQLDVAQFFSAADVFVMSSISEGLPVSLLQAFSLGLPAIVTDVGGMAEVVRSANAGMVIPNLNAPAMATAMLQMTANRTQRMQFASNAFAAFDANFNLQTMVDAYMEIYLNTHRARKRRNAE
jgi:L-malate glycosyltransferase